MNKVMAWAKKLWADQPLRSTAYTATGIVLAYLLATGRIGANLDNDLLTLAGLILVGGGTEIVHTQVAPVNGTFVANLVAQAVALVKPPNAPPKV